MNSKNREIDGEEGSSFVQKHMAEHHQGQQKNFTGKVIKTNKDSFSRQIREGVYIRRCNKEMLNSKTEWFQPPLYRVRNEVVRE